MCCDTEPGKNSSRTDTYGQSTLFLPHGKPLTSRTALWTRWSRTTGRTHPKQFGFLELYSPVSSPFRLVESMTENGCQDVLYLYSISRRHPLQAQRSPSLIVLRSVDHKLTARTILPSEITCIHCSERRITAGVQQSSSLDTFLFSVYVNNMTNVPRERLSLFARGARLP